MTLPLQIIAEIGLNHLGVAEQAIALGRAAADAGATHCKLQCHRGQSAPAAHPFVEGWTRESYYRATDWSDAEWARVIERMPVPVVVSPFGAAALEFCERLPLSGLKVASGEALDPYRVRTIARVAVRHDWTLYVSQGLTAVQQIIPGAIHLHCVSEYPTPPQHFGLRAVSECFGRHGIGWGLSDHSPGGTVGPACAAAALGATVVERHIGFDRRAWGSDHGPHMDTIDEFARYVREVRAAHQACAPVDREALMASGRITALRAAFAAQREDADHGTAA